VRYTAAWCSQNPALVAAFYSNEGSLRVNDDPPAVGRQAQVAQSFMSAFPDLCVVMDDLRIEDEVEYHWTLFGTPGAPGGTGHGVRIILYGLNKSQSRFSRPPDSNSSHTCETPRKAKSALEGRRFPS
jgi:hypothetical protein